MRCCLRPCRASQFSTFRSPRPSTTSNMSEIKEDLITDNDEYIIDLIRRKKLAIPTLQGLLTIFNIFYWMVGLAMFCGGMWTLFELHKYVDVPSDFGGTAPYLMFGLGAFTLIITSFAFSCIHRKQTLLLYIYSACLACVFMINMGLMISMVCYREALCNGLFEGLTRTIQNYNPETTNIDFAQSTFQCCGVTNYTDWIKSSPTKVIPTSCCIDPTNCVTANYGDVYNKGCYALIREYISNNLPTIIAVAGGMGTFPFFGSFLAYLLGRHIYDLKMYAKGKYAAYVT